MTGRATVGVTCIALCLASAGCGDEFRMESAPHLDDIATRYLLLELAMERHDSNHVDAYYGPASLRETAGNAALTLQQIADQAGELTALLADWPGNRSNRMELARINGLRQRLTALSTRVAINEGKSFPFDEESELLFGVTAPSHGAGHFEEILEKIDALVPGDGSLSSRVNAFQNQFVIPGDRLGDVFDAAIDECRRRTLEHITLPQDESFQLEYVTDKPWSGYNWYLGESQSLIQVNTDLPIFVHRAVDLGCHEGYPGHHTFNVLLEENLVERQGWVEFTLYPLFSPASLIAEGSGNYGIELAFPSDERALFEKEHLFPLAGLQAEDADRYYALLELLEQLNYAGNEAARNYLNGDMGREQAIQWLVDYTLSSPERAGQRVDFFDTYRSYVINYNLGKDLVRRWVEKGTDSSTARLDEAEVRRERWRRFERLLSTPMLPSDLVDQGPTALP